MATKQQRERRDEIVYSSAKERAQEHEKGFTPTAWRIPDDMPIFKFRDAKRNRLSILPWRLGEGGSPYAKEGATVHSEHTYWTHPVGPDNRHYCCPRKTFGRPKCCVCTHFSKLSGQPNVTKEMLSEFRPKERQLFCVFDHDDPDKGLQIMECAHFGKDPGFGQLIDNLMESFDEDDPRTRFYHLKGGSILNVTTKQRSFNGKTYYIATVIDMQPRKKDFDPSILDDVPCLGELPIEIDNEELTKIFMQTPDDADDAPAPKSNKPAAGKRRPVVEAEPDEEVIEDDEPAPTPRKAPAKKPAAKQVEEPEEPEPEDTPEEEPELEWPDKGDKVSFFYQRKRYTGKVVKCYVSEKSGKNIVQVLCPDRDQPHVVELEDLITTKIEPEPEPEEPEPDDEPAPTPRKTPAKAPAKRPKVEEPEETEPDDEPAPAPRKAPGKPTAKPVEEDSGDPDWDAEDEPIEDDEPAPKPAAKKPSRR